MFAKYGFIHSTEPIFAKYIAFVVLSHDLEFSPSCALILFVFYSMQGDFSLSFCNLSLYRKKKPPLRLYQDT